MVGSCTSKKGSYVLGERTRSSIQKYIFNEYTLQVTATLIASLLQIPLMGFNLAFSAVLIAQLEECQNAESICKNTIHITETDSSWIASLFTIFVPVGGVIGGIMLDYFGRLAVLRLSAIPGIIGWVVLATATNIQMLTVGRILNGVAAAWTISAVMVYVSEICKPHIRGSMISIPSTFGALGIALVYTMGYFVDWRVIAWVSVAMILLSVLLSVFLPQSAEWLISKGKTEMAKAALESINKFHADPEKETRDRLDALMKLYCTDEEGSSAVNCIDKLKLLTDPTVYKPLLILCVFSYFVQFAGINVIIFYTVSLFKDAGTNIDPFIASIGIGTARFLTSVCTVGLMQRYGRRLLMIVSGLIMGISIGISGLYTRWIIEGTTTHMWVPLVMMVIYAVATMIGFLVIPLAIPAELFPTKVRGMGQGMALGLQYALVFASIRSYYDLKNALGGSSGIQFFFAAMSFGGVLYTFIFLPETHKKNLHEIEEYFKHNSVYLCYLISASRKQNTRKKEISVIV